MPLRTSHYAPSKTLYAIDWSTFEVPGPRARAGSQAWVKVIGTVTKGGVTRVTKGALACWSNPAAPILTIEEFKSQVNGSGVNIEARWDGDYMWAPNATLAVMVKLARELNPVLDMLPEVPAGYDGWYHLAPR